MAYRDGRAAISFIETRQTAQERIDGGGGISSRSRSVEPMPNGIHIHVNPGTNRYKEYSAAHINLEAFGDTHHNIGNELALGLIGGIS
ncbi:hypothetical protein GC096_26090 [Paenibacillus sp. LMG 31461]|uniref:Uncharacterized protein n=1 Tax=Paenibacillus plantarum TaxID=2654975 RepID=A0ABX1XGJ1_9BACL|nr:hypothetical protein [Paenibacillus plantarum]NOU67517.1 hypothetical protein [Paenibacillus plantarum]